MSKGAGQRFAAVSQILIGTQYAQAREVDFRWSVDGILTECRNYRQTVALLCTIVCFGTDDNRNYREKHAAAANEVSQIPTC